MTTERRTGLILALFAITLGFAPLTVFAGNLNPPEGPTQHSNRTTTYPEKIASLPCPISRSRSLIFLNEASAEPRRKSNHGSGGGAGLGMTDPWANVPY